MGALSDEIAEKSIPTKERVSRLAALLERSGISIDDIGSIDSIKVWQGFYKDSEGDAHTVDMTGVVISPVWGSGPEWPVVQQAAPTVIKPVKSAPAKRDTKVTVILPDPQIGYRRMSDGELIPIHDESAIDVALQITGKIKPDKIINLGDLLDLPEWSSKFLVLPEFVLTTQPTIDYAHTFLAKQRALVPDAEIHLLGGNHDNRLGIAIAKNAMAAMRLKRANAPEEWPLLSIPYLLRLDDLQVQYTGAYPAGRIQITEGGHGMTPLWAIHGEKLDVVKVAKSERQSFVQGHIHRIAIHSETFEYRNQPETVTAFSPGCLCRVDGLVPSTKSGEDEHGRPYQRWENWQQGLAVVTELPDGYWTVEIVPIHHGKAVYRGNEFTASTGE